MVQRFTVDDMYGQSILSLDSTLKGTVAQDYISLKWVKMDK